MSNVKFNVTDLLQDFATGALALALVVILI